MESISPFDLKTFNAAGGTSNTRVCPEQQAVVSRGIRLNMWLCPFVRPHFSELGP